MNGKRHVRKTVRRAKPARTATARTRVAKHPISPVRRATTARRKIVRARKPVRKIAAAKPSFMGPHFMNRAFSF
jgi:hypothetical protein